MPVTILSPVLFFATSLGLCWGSFLNVVACRLIEGRSLQGRSACCRCHRTLSWWELIPVLSWIGLRGACATCKAAISILYPLIELATAAWFVMVVLYLPQRYWVASVLFGSAMLVSMRTDAEHFLILTIVSLGLMPLGVAAAALQLIPVTLFDSCMGLALGFGLFALVRAAFFYLRGVEGLGWGDVELLGSIGSFVGPFGVWLTVTIASLLGSLYGCILMLRHGGNAQLKVPFALFLGFGALCAYLWPDLLVLLYQLG